MLDDLNPQGGRPESQQPKRARAESSPLTDREVPLAQGRNNAALHAWLDGEVAESAVRTADSARDIDFWRKVTAETDRRRTMKTPAYLEAQIMAALPMQQTPADGVQTWWARDVTMTPATAAVAAASLLAVGAAATVAVLRAIR